MKDKNIVIVGGNSGIGKVLAEELKILGANLFLYSRSQKGSHSLDVTGNFEHLEGLPEVIHGLVYCPGSINLKPFQRLSMEDYRVDMELNTFGAIKVLQACFKALKLSKGAAVVLFSSVAVQTGMGFHSSIACAKGALEGLTRSLAAEWSMNRIRVNAIAPSLTDTGLAGSLLATDEKRDASNKRHPMGRVGRPDDIASAALFLLSENASWVTGQILHIDGGFSAIRTV